MAERLCRNPIDRFSEKVEIINGDCWSWTGYTNKGGYGVFYMPDMPTLAHRWSYEFYVKAIPEGMQIDHLCRNRCCVNPEHLEVVTQQENIRRGNVGAHRTELSSKRTHCKHGHELKEGNLYLWRGMKNCKICKIKSQRKTRERTKNE